jgi:predicted RNase H-like nuclease (RuvC/YqgF family)
MYDMNEDELMVIYEWIDSIPLSKQKKNIARDFSDGKLLAEVIKYYLPKMVDINNYPSSSNTNQKNYNWLTLNNKVLKKINVKLSKNEINDIISYKNYAIEHLLEKVYKAIEEYTGQNLGMKKKNILEKKKENAMGEDINDIKLELEIKRSEVENLSNIIKTLQQKLQNANMTKNNLERRIVECTQQLRARGVNI